MKKVQIQMDIGQGNAVESRPSTSSCRFSDMNQNGGYVNTSPINTRLPKGAQQLGSPCNSSPTHEKPLIKAGKKGHAQKFYM
ncbi:hypothetical protein Leryth_021667 [Lithospermum erythrorhizon]|nr:hypothetical protein Leryth_021667 [Lithospermum erythrorhizon]